MPTTRIPRYATQAEASKIVRASLLAWQGKRFANESPHSDLRLVIKAKLGTDEGAHRARYRDAIRAVREGFVAGECLTHRQVLYNDAAKVFLASTERLFEGRTRSGLSLFLWLLEPRELDNTTAAKLAIIGGHWPSRWQQAGNGFLTVGKIVQHMAGEIRELKRTTK